MIAYCAYYKNSRRKIISVYSDQTYFGMGDYIRGLLHLYQNEDENRIYVNYKNHPMSKYLINEVKNNVTDEEIAGQIIYKTNEKNYDDFKKFDKTLCLYHNGVPNYPINQNILDKVRKTFVPTLELNIHIREVMNKVNIIEGKFIVIHIRLVDGHLLRSRLYMDNGLTKLLEDLKESTYPILIMSNSTITKHSISRQYGYKILDIIPVHTGGKTYDKIEETKTTTDEIKDTLVEFFILSKAKHIYQHNEQKGTQSGFSQRIAELYNIPITRI